MRKHFSVLFVSAIFPQYSLSLGEIAPNDKSSICNIFTLFDSSEILRLMFSNFLP